MKIAVYAIAKNEEKFAERFAKSCRGADEVLVLDTGSTDDTVHVLKDHGVQVLSATVAPWRFDVARNTALSLVSSDVDVCVPLDLDEVLVDGWRNVIEKEWTEGTTRLRYEFVWSWKLDGSPGVSFQQDKIHARSGYFWKGIIHECVTPDPRTEERYADTRMRIIEHHPDDSKSRGQYLDLLKIAVAEAPHDDRMRHYYGRELKYRSEWEEAINVLCQHLAMPSAVWTPERAASMRLISRCFAHLGRAEESFRWARRACAEAPHTREPWVLLALLTYQERGWPECYAAAKRALAITERPPIYINEPEAWGALPHDLVAISAYHLGLKEEALEHAKEAVRLEPDDERLRGNLDLISRR